MDNRLKRDVYKLLSECYYPPDEKLIKRLQELKGPVKNVFQNITEAFFEEPDIKALKVDFAKLFVGPFKLIAPPYGSVYLESSGKVMGDFTIAVRDMYEREGLRLKIKDVPDHIAIELEFMYYLIFKEIHEKEKGDLEKAAYYSEQRKIFLQRYMAEWIPEFVQNVKSNAETRFYKGLAMYTGSFIKSELALAMQAV